MNRDPASAAALVDPLLFTARQALDQIIRLPSEGREHGDLKAFFVGRPCQMGEAAIGFFVPNQPSVLVVAETIDIAPWVGD